VLQSARFGVPPTAAGRGILGIVDHQAVSGSPSETGSTLHRIDSAIVIAELESVGFVLDGESDALANAEDDHT